MNKSNFILVILSLLLINPLKVFCQDSIQSGAKVSFAKNAEMFSKGIASKYNENHEEAINCFEKALEFFPEDHASMYELSSLYKARGLSEKGFEMIKKAVELDSVNKWYKIRLADFYKQNNDYNSFIEIYDGLLDGNYNDGGFMFCFLDC